METQAYGSVLKFHVWVKSKGFNGLFGVQVEVRGKRADELNEVMRDGDHVTCFGGVIGIPDGAHAMHMLARDVILQEDICEEADQ
jgi:hypothetical protein